MCVCVCVCACARARQLVWLLGISARWARVCKPVGLTPKRQNERASFMVAGSLYRSTLVITKSLGPENFYVITGIML